tara:strand:- start:106 stop:276 length:171 start_codon:yes stop_codon:yes gene_type:complete
MAKYNNNELKIGFWFYALCGKHLIDVGIALENEELIKLLKNKADYKTIDKFLLEQF